MTVDERLYLIDDVDLGVIAETRTDVIDRHINRYRKAMYLADRRGGRWLDCACGSGYGTEMIAAVADEAVGVDNSAWAIKYALQHYPTPIFYTGKAHHITPPIPRLYFDVAISVETLEHLPLHGQWSMIEGLGECLKADGVLVLACPLGNGEPPRNPHHVHEPTERELRSMLTRYFRNVTIDTEEYESTSGPAVQAWAVCREPKQ